jgi:hypothetical protein
MGHNTKENLTVSIIVLALTTVTLTIAPFSAYHPYSIPKLLPLVGFSLALLPFIFTTLNKDIYTRNKFILSMLLAHLVVSMIVLFYPQNSLQQEIYGISGRNNGFLAHTSYIILMTASILILSDKNRKKIINVAILVGWVVLIYGMLQSFKLVEISSLTGLNNRATGFFGNINFYSAFIALIMIINLSLIFDFANSKIEKIINALFVSIGMLGIYLSESQQGFLVFGVGFSIIIFLKLKSKSQPKLTYLFAFLTATFLVLITFGFFQFGPMKDYVYEKSISYRGYYWRAGIDIFRENILWGTGFDGYRDWYRRLREPASVVELGPRDLPDSAHNYFVDTAVNGGIFLIITYLIIILYTIMCTIKIIKNLKEYNSISVAIVAAFYGFTSQQLLSLPQHGITIWGWVLAGLVISTANSNSLLELGDQSRKNRSQGGNLIFSSLILFIVGLAITAPALNNSNNYRKSVEIQDVNLLYTTALKFPQDANMLAAASRALIGMEDFSRAKDLLLNGSLEFPQYYEIWYLYSLLPNLSSEELRVVNQNMIKLEPLLSK